MKTKGVKAIFVPLLVSATFFFSFFISFASPAVSEISVVMDDSYPPYVFRDSEGKLQGILLDQWALWEERTGIKVNVTATDWNIALSDMQYKKFDAIDTVFESEARHHYLSFTGPYADIDVSIFFRNTISGITDVDSLVGFIVGVKSGDASIEYLHEHGINTLVEYDSYEDLVLAAKEGDIVAFVADKPPTLYFLYKHNINKEFNYTQPLYTGQFHRAVAKGDAELLALVEEGFSQISHEENAAIIEKWFGQSNEDLKDIFGKLALLGITVAGIALFLMVWNISLKNTVREKTSEIMKAVEESQHSNRRLNAMIKAIPDLIFIVNSEGVIVDYLSDVNREDLYKPDEVFSHKSITELLPQDLSSRYMRKIKLAAKSNTVQHFMYSMDIRGSKKYYEARLSLVEENTMLCIIRDITKEQRSQAKIYEMSTVDPVTGLFNRNYFEKEIQKLSAKKADRVGIVMCDIDGLKLINDTMGHQAGDFYLYSVGQILTSVVKERGFVARIGGDEFAIVIQHSSTEEILSMIDQINRDVAASNDDNADEVPISISLGYSLVGVDQEDLESALVEADDYMYRNKLHHRQSVRSYSIDLLSRLLAERDFITEGHGDRMQENVKKMAVILDFSPDDINDLLLFAQFHDIGKVGIPDAILYKNQNLTAAEWGEMKRHSEIGFRIAESSPDLRHISEWILKHHEWWDGSGYPMGLKKVEIPLECRMLSIVDAFDAMTNDRPYQKARTQDEAFEELRKFSGRQFDPELVELFIDMFNVSS